MGKFSESDVTSCASTPAIFPLKLTPLEKYFFWDDRPEQPLTPLCELNFATLLDRDLLQDAISKVVVHNPILNARVVEQHGDLFWIPISTAFQLSEPTVFPPVVDGLLRPIDLHSEAGCRFWYEPTSSGSRLLWQMHHCCCDGVAMRSVLIDILHRYAMATESGDGIATRERLGYERNEIEALNERYDFSHLGQPKRTLSIWQRLKNAHYFHFQTPQPLIGSLKSPVRDQNDAPLRHLTLDRELSDRILTKCRESSLGVNEVAIALLFQTCALWNRAKGDHNPRSRFRILMPYDLRGRNDMRMPATNRLSFTFMGRTSRQCDDLPELIRSLQLEIVDIKDTHVYLDFLNGLAVASKVPRLFRWALRNSNCMATAVITYTGDLSRGMNKLFPDVGEFRRIGNALLQSVSGGPPVRRNTNISLGLCINWGQIHISAARNRTAFSARDCEEFLSLYHNGWHDWVTAVVET